MAKRTAVAEFLEANKRSREYTLSVFEQMPEEDMEFKPLPELFSFQRHFTHCIEFTAGQLTARLQIKDPFANIQWDKLSKAQTKKELSRFYDLIDRVVKEATPAQLAQTGNFGGDKEVDLLRLLYICENHLIHHRGALMIYLRHKQIVPNGYVGW
ncbi:MAG: DinB family protein [Spirosomataceae bacterium]